MARYNMAVGDPNINLWHLDDDPAQNNPRMALDQIGFRTGPLPLPFLPTAYLQITNGGDLSTQLATTTNLE